MMFLVTRTSMSNYGRDEMPCENCIQVGKYIGWDCFNNREKQFPMWGIELETAKDIVRFKERVENDITIYSPTEYFLDRMVFNEPYCSQAKVYVICIDDVPYEED